MRVDSAAILPSVWLKLAAVRISAAFVPPNYYPYADKL